MYDITDESIKSSPGVTACGNNPQKYESNSLDIHIDAVTGDIWDGEGCGGGPSKILETYNPSNYPEELLNNKVDLSQFHSEFVINQGDAPVIDGVINNNEWSDAGYTKIDQYGRTVELWSTISNNTMYWAVKTDTKQWIALLQKASPHHGMASEFKDVKLLSVNGVEDYHIKSLGGMMRGITLESDQVISNLLQASRDSSNGRVYEFAMPLQGGEGNVDLEIGEYSSIALYFGANEIYSGSLSANDAFSKQLVAHIGGDVMNSVITTDVPAAIIATYGEAAPAPGDRTGNIAFYIIIAVTGIMGFVLYRKVYHTRKT